MKRRTRPRVAESDLLSLGQRRDQPLGAANQRHHVDRITAPPVLARFDLRELEQVADEGVEPVAMRLHDPEKFLALSGLFVGAVQERLQVPDDRGQRGAQLVRDVRDKIRADSLEALEARHIVEDEDRPALVVTRVGTARHGALHRKRPRAV